MFLIYGIVLGITQNVKYNGFQAFLITTSFFLIYFIYTRFRIHSKKNFSIEFRGIILAFIMMILLHIPWIFMLGIGDYMKETGIFSLSILSNIDINNILLIFKKGIEFYINLFIVTKANLLFNTVKILFYPYILILWTSPILILFFIVSFHGRITKEKLILFIWFIFILLFFSLGYKVSRAMIPAIPAFSILSAIGCIKFTDFIKNKLDIIKKYNSQIISVIVIIILFTSLPSLINIISNTHNGYRIAGIFLKENVKENEYIFFSGGPQIRFYYPNASWWRYCDNISSEDIKYVILDYMKYSYDDEFLYNINNIEKNVKPLIILKNQIVEPIIISQINLDKNKDDLDKIIIFKIKEEDKELLKFLDSYREKICNKYELI